MLAALVLAAGCTAPPAFPVAGDFLPLISNIEALVDRGRALSHTEITRAPACGTFVPLPGQPNFGAVAGAVWLRFHPQLADAAAGHWRLVVRFAGLEKVCVHWPLRGGTVMPECLVRADLAGRARWQNGRLVFAIPAELDTTAPVHVYAESKLWLKVPMELTTAEYLLQRETRREHAWGVYYGLLAMLVVVGLGFYLGRRDRAFLYFALKIGALTLALALWQGRFVMWDPAGWSLTKLAPVFTGLFLSFGTRFYQHFLLTRRYAPSAHRLLEVCFWAGLATAAMVAVFPVLAVQAMGIASLVWLCAVLWAALQRVRQRYWPALWILAAVSVLLVAIFMNAMAIVGVLLLEAGLTLQLAYLGNMIAAGFLVFGLMSRVRLLGAERDRATELASANRNLALYRAHFDEVTGLANRAKFKEDLQERIAAMGTAARRLAIVTLGPDRFRAINHALGHEGGDAVLVEIAGRLRHETRTDEQLGRIGPAMFAVLMELEPGEGLAGLDARCAALRKALATPLMSGRGATLSLSMGAALYPDHGTVADQLLRCSDEAYYRAKDLGGGLLRVFDPQFHQNAERYLELNQDLRHALARDELDLHYQPLCALQRSDVLGVEALLRWNRKGEDIPPEQFIPIAEASDLIAPLTDWVFRRACRQAHEWRGLGLDVPVCVNVSAPQFRLPGFVARIDSALKEFSVPGPMLVIEITESLLMDDLDATRATLRQLRERGVEAAVDDFGVGYSSLSYLRTLPVRSIKIDRSFLFGIPHEPEAVAVINAIIALGRDLGLTVIAEGIETLAQNEFLVAQGVTVGQGFWIARPMPAAALEQWLHDRSATTAAA